MSTTMLGPEQFWARFFQLIRISLLLGFVYLVYKGIVRIIFTYRVRNLYHEFPSLPRHRLWGNLENVGPRLHPSINQHPDYAFEELWNELGQPPAYVIDFAPVDRAMLVISDPGMAEFITQPSDEHRYSLPKSNSLEAMTTLIGNHSLLITEGEEWRTLRRRFNKGFSSSHLHTLIPLIVSKTRIYLDRLRAYARKGQDFALKDLASDLTTDVITEIAIEKDFHAQTVPDGEGAKSTFGILTSIRIMSTLIEKVGQGFDPAGYFSIQRRIKEWLYDKLYTRAIYNEIVKKLPNMSGEKSIGPSTTKAIVHLALSGVDPTQAVLDSTVSQVKTFLFAGQDTTSTLTQWMAWELSKSYPASPLYSERNRQIREKLCAEHDAVFGAVNPFAPLDVLSNPNANIDEILGAKLPYTTAFIKEILRLYPPAGSARIVPLAPYDPNIASDKKPGPFFIDMPAWTNSRTGEHHPETRIRADGMRLYNNHFLIQRNPKIWGPDAHEFEPARFLDRSGKGSVDELEEALKVGGKSSAVDYKAAGSKADLPHPYHISILPAGSFRAFERGPRTCIGSNLAYMEAKIVLAIMARGFEWTKVGLDGRRPRPGEVVYGGTGKEDMQLGEKRGWKVWNINNVTSVPVDGMRMRIKLRQ